MKVGVIYVAHRAAGLIEDSLPPWLVFRDLCRAGLEPHSLTIAAVCVPFESFPVEPGDDGTLYSLQQYHQRGDIAHLITSETPMKETDARGAALRKLVDDGVDILWQVDADEIYTLDEIRRILAFVESRPGIAWFRGSLKNYVFDDRTFLVQSFTPARIHRADLGAYRAHSFWDDNNVAYGGKITRDIRRDVEFPTVTIPKSVAWVRHLTWLNDGPNGRSHRKVRYQEVRQWQCSFAWDDSCGGLIWRDGVNPPEVARD